MREIGPKMWMRFPLMPLAEENKVYCLKCNKQMSVKEDNWLYDTVSNGYVHTKCSEGEEE